MRITIELSDDAAELEAAVEKLRAAL